MFERQAVPAGDTGETTAFIGKGSRITGTIVLEGGGRIEGAVEGEITAGARLVVGDGAVVNASVKGTVVAVHGQVTGDITASDLLEIQSTATVRGDIRASRLVVHEGARFEGRCAMGDEGRVRSTRDASILLRGEGATSAPPPSRPTQ